ncbi:MAG: hypothetical protein JXK07_11210 [Spirochaetes bacterium]|nr:hypothetical protein [Spirochaetota bacterium]MBN2772208.1 hypothetical protein [Spirochaetota bacterium]
MSDYYGYPEYVSVAQKKKKAKEALEKIKKKNSQIKPVVIEGTKIAKTWWGIAWIKNLECYADYSNRIGRGRSYVRHGSVLDLQIEKGLVRALVKGSRSQPYKIDIKITPLDKARWKEMILVCEGKLDSLQELLSGKFPTALADLFTIKNKGLFPSPKQIEFDCSCPDWASMCKHVAAVLYGVGARFDEDPSLFFLLRGVNVDDLISKAVIAKSDKMMKQASVAGRRVIKDVDLLTTFGIESEGLSLAESSQRIIKKAVSKKVASSKAVSKKAASKKAVSKKVSSKKAASKKVSSKKAASKKAFSKKAASKKAFSKKAFSKKAISKKAISKKAVSKKAVSN